MKIKKTHTYMEPVEFPDGHGFRSVVELASGEHALISEVHRETPHARIDEVLVFRCGPDGEVADWSDIFSASTTAEAFASVSSWRLSLFDS